MVWNSHANIANNTIICMIIWERESERERGFNPSMSKTWQFLCHNSSKTKHTGFKRNFSYNYLQKNGTKGDKLIGIILNI